MKHPLETNVLQYVTLCRNVHLKRSLETLACTAVTSAGTPSHHVGKIICLTSFLVLV